MTFNYSIFGILFLLLYAIVEIKSTLTIADINVKFDLNNENKKLTFDLIDINVNINDSEFEKCFSLALRYICTG